MALFSKVAVCFLVMLWALVAGGCAFGDRHVQYIYTPVLLAKIEKPVSVTVATLASQRKPGEAAQIAQIRNGLGMVTAKVVCAQGNPMIWTADALAAELKNAGFTVQRVEDTAPAGGGLQVRGVVKQFYADMGMQVVMRIRVSFTVMRGQTVLLEKDYEVDEGLGMILASDNDYTKLVNQGLVRLMRRAGPDIMAALQK